VELMATKVKMDTKEKIIDQARGLFAERGYNGATTSEIARRVGVSEAALYKHFKSKKEILLACITPSVPVKLEISMAPSAKEIVGARVDLVRNNLDSFNILFKESLHHPEIAQMFLEQVYIKDRRMEHLIRKFRKGDLSPQKTLIYELGITSAIWSVLNYQKIQGQHQAGNPGGDMAEEMAHFLLYGIAGHQEEQEENTQ
jgi:AcrR family transcriptional regulator